MNTTNFIQSGTYSQALFGPSRCVYVFGNHDAESASSNPDEEKAKESAEAAKKKPPGVPIDQPVQSANQVADMKRRILEAAKKKVSEEEKKIVSKYGGDIIEMDKVPGNEGKEYKNQVFVNAPKNPEKFIDKDGKPIPPRVVYYFHGNGGKIGDSAEAIMHQVEQMRANGDNVILVMPQDNQGHWKDMEKPEAFKDMQKMVETMMGGKPIKDISISSFSGGYAGVEKLLKNLRENSDKDQEAIKLYKNIRNLGFLDSAYGGAEEFAEWAKDKTHSIFSNYTAKCESGNRLLENAVREARGGDMTGISITSFKGIHGNAPLAFMEAMQGRASTVGEDIEDVSVRDAFPRIPERSPDAMSPEQFEKALRGCKSEDEKNELYMQQWSLGNVPDKFREFQRVHVKKGGHDFEFVVSPFGLGVGNDDRFTEPAFDGYLAAAANDSFNCALPTKWLVEQREKQANARRVHFSHQGEFAQELNDEQGNPLDPRITHGARTWSADFILKHNEKIRESARERGINWDGLVVGYEKTVVLPEPGVTPPGRLEIFGGIFDDGKRAQPLSGGFHGERQRDYSQGDILVAKFLYKDGELIKAQQASRDEEIMSDPEMAKLINGMIGKLPSYDYRKDATLRKYADRMREGLPAAKAVSSAETAPSQKEPTVSPETSPPVAHATEHAPSPLPAPSASPEAAPRRSSGIPIRSESSASSPSYVPSSKPEPREPAQTTPPPSTPEPVHEQVETTSSNKVLVIGDSLSMGFTSKIKGFDVVQAQTKSEKDSTGAHTADMLKTLRNKVRTENVANTTLVVMGGTNDIFMPDSLEPIKKNLSSIYTLAKDKDMKVVAATLPPVGYSQYAKMNWQAVQKNPAYKNRFSSYEDYNSDLISRWRELNTWIMGRKGINDDSGKGPDEVVEFHQVLENSNLPGSLTKDNYGEGGIHLKDYTVMGNAFTEAVSRLNPGQGSSAKYKKPAQTAASGAPGTRETPSENPSFNITSEAKVEIKSASNPSKQEALAQNAEIRKQVTGYSGLSETVEGLGNFAKSLLASHPFGAIVYFNDGTEDYVAVKEWHPPYDSSRPDKPQKWHHGVSVLKKGA